MAASVVLGQRVQLRVDSVFAGKSPNPAAGAIGTVMLLDNDWVGVLWDGFTIEYNYRVTELDWYGAPPTNSGEWGWAQAFQDAKNQPVATILDRINQLSPNYDEPFAVMYSMFVQTGQIVDRITVVQLMPLISAGNKDSVSWNASGDIPAGTLSVSGVYTNNVAYSCWKMLDGSFTTYWYPTSQRGVGSWWKVHFETPCRYNKFEASFSGGDFRPTKLRVDISNDDLSWETLTILDVPTNASTPNAMITFDLPPAGFYKYIRITCTQMVNPLVAGYAVIDFKLYGVVN